MRYICIYGWHCKQEKGEFSQHFAFHGGEKDKDKWQKAWLHLGWHCLWDPDAKNSPAA